MHQAMHQAMHKTSRHTLRPEASVAFLPNRVWLMVKYFPWGVAPKVCASINSRLSPHACGLICSMGATLGHVRVEVDLTQS